MSSSFIAYEPAQSQRSVWGAIYDRVVNGGRFVLQLWDFFDRHFAQHA